MRYYAYTCSRSKRLSGAERAVGRRYYLSLRTPETCAPYDRQVRNDPRTDSQTGGAQRQHTHTHTRERARSHTHTHTHTGPGGYIYTCSARACVCIFFLPLAVPSASFSIILYTCCIVIHAYAAAAATTTTSRAWRKGPKIDRSPPPVPRRRYISPSGRWGWDGLREISRRCRPPITRV